MPQTLNRRLISHSCNVSSSVHILRSHLANWDNGVQCAFLGCKVQNFWAMATIQCLDSNQAHIPRNVSYHTTHTGRLAQLEDGDRHWISVGLSYVLAEWVTISSWSLSNELLRIWWLTNSKWSRSAKHKKRSILIPCGSPFRVGKAPWVSGVYVALKPSCQSKPINQLRGRSLTWYNIRL